MGSRGYIYFGQNEFPFGQSIFRILQDGTGGPIALTDYLSQFPQQGGPSNRVVFAYDFFNPAGKHLRLMNADGTNPVDLPNSPFGIEHQTAYDPNSEVVYYVIGSSGILGRINTDGTGNQILATGVDPYRVDYGTVGKEISALSPAQVWIGLANSDDNGIRFDLMAEAYVQLPSASASPSLIGSGRLDSVAGGSSGFNNAKLNAVPLTLSVPVQVQSGDALSIKLLVRNACTGSGKNSGRGRLWFNDSAANSRFDTTIDGASSDWFLRDGYTLAGTPGPGPKKTIDAQAGSKCSAFKPFGTWTTTIP